MEFGPGFTDSNPGNDYWSGTGYDPSGDQNHGHSIAEVVGREKTRQKSEIVAQSDSGCPPVNPCDTYKDKVLGYYRNGYYEADPYRDMAEEACNKFREKYPNKRTDCVANCLATNELKNDEIYDPVDRNYKRLADHISCYSKCGYWDPIFGGDILNPLDGFPDGILDVGFQMY